MNAAFLVEEKHTYVIHVRCIVCNEDFDYRINLPTAVVCDHCGSLVDARLGIFREEMRKKSYDKKRRAKVAGNEVKSAN